MLTHTWVEQYRNKPIGPALSAAVRSAVQFDFGDTDEVPVARGVDFMDSRPPFNDCVLQFAIANNKPFTHILIFWRGQPDGSVHLMSAWKLRSIDEWLTTPPIEITRTADGFKYEGMEGEETIDEVQRAHAMVLNAFYVLGCANVKTVDHDAPAALNKKRARSGKFPILTHKTLMVVADAPRTARVDRAGTGTSPRVHLRRGHIRRLDEVRRVWVQPCVVGSNHGVVTKDYRVTARAALLT